MRAYNESVNAAAMGVFVVGVVEIVSIMRGLLWLADFEVAEAGTANFAVQKSSCHECGITNFFCSQTAPVRSPEIVVVAVDWCEIRNGAYDQWRDALA